LDEPNPLPRLWSSTTSGDAPPSSDVSGGVALPPMLPLAIGDVLDRKYEIVSVLGAGAMATVFEGRHLRLNKRVAIKVLYNSIAANPTMMRRFRREARIAGALGHPNVCTVFDLAETADGVNYLVMALLEGESLAARLEAERQLSIEDTCAIGIAMLAGLGAAHAAGVVHRDIKPANVFLASVHGGSQVKLIDFGISKFDASDATQLTRLGHLIGTPAYMAPEQVAGLQVDHRADIYATGVVLYECLTGQRPFEARSLEELLAKVKQGLFPTVRFLRPDVPEALEHLILHAMQPSREKRPGSAQEMERQLRAVLAALAPRPVDESPPVSIVLDEGALRDDDADDDPTEIMPPRSSE